MELFIRGCRMNFLVTGGAGFIGSAVVKILLKNNHNVVVLDNLFTGSLDNLPANFSNFIHGDIRSIEDVSKAMKNIDGVFHLAALVSVVKSVDGPFDDCDVNVRGTLNLLDVAVKNGVKKFIYSSSGATYGELRSQIIDENHPLEPKSPYGVSKLSGELYALTYGRLYPIITIALRYFNVFGIGQRYDDYGNVIPIFLQRIKDGFPLTIYGDGEQTRDFINVQDVAYANYLAMMKAVDSNFYNVGTGKKITINYLADQVIKNTGIKAPILYKDARSGEVKHACANIKKIKTELGFEPQVDFHVGIKEYCKWFLV